MASIILTKTSVATGKKHRMRIPLSKSKFMKAHNLWCSGVLIQDAFPTLTVDQREFVVSGMTPDEWDQLFKEIE